MSKGAKTKPRIILCAAACAGSAMAAAAELPEAIQARGEAVVLEVHAIGAQVYECRADGSGKLEWRFREPLAALIQNGKTVGRHYAGPTWEIGESAITAKSVAQAPGATAGDIPWLRLSVSDRRGAGPLSDVATVQRINTVGGSLSGACEVAGDLIAQPYAADYVFLK